MTEYLLKHFVKNHEEIHDEKVRLSYGMLSSIVGIVCNLILFAAKLSIGTLMHAVAIVSDAFNNLSDCMSSIVTLIGYRLAAKPADKEHPFGHGRIEYMVSMIVAVFIFLVGWELAKTSIDRIRHPEPVLFSLPMLVVLVLTVLVKLWMSGFNKTLGTKIDNIAMIATSEDSRNDVFVTIMTIAAMLVARLAPNVPVDGIAGLAVAVLIFRSGYGISAQIIDKLLGKPADHATVQAIKGVIMHHPEIIGMHDLMVHDYGPGSMFGSCHVEVDSEMDFLKAHDVVDEAERELWEQLRIAMTLHMDPVDIHNENRNKYLKLVEDRIKKLNPNLTVHDFRMVAGPTHTNLVFDVVIPFGCNTCEEEVEKAVNECIAEIKPKLYAVITFDHDFTEKESA